MESTVRDRLLQYIDHLNMSVNSFEKAYGFSSSSISKYLRGDQKSIGIEKIEHILYKDDNLNSEWLLRGKGDMLRTGYDQSIDKLTVASDITGIYQSEGRVNRGEVTKIFNDFAQKFEGVIDRINQRVDKIEKEDKKGT